VLKEMVPFVLFSIIDGLALIVIVLTLYRFKLTDAVWPVLFVALIMSLQSFLLREELDLTNLVPFINTLLIALLLTAVLQIPFHWSVMGVLGGYFIYITLQYVVVEASFGFFTTENLKGNHVRGYIFQIVISTIAYLASKFLYSRGIGIATDFKKRIKGEKAIVTFAITLAILLFGFVLVKKDIILDLILVAGAMGFFLYILIKKEVAK